MQKITPNLWLKGKAEVTRASLMVLVSGDRLNLVSI